METAMHAHKSRWSALVALTVTATLLVGCRPPDLPPPAGQGGWSGTVTQTLESPKGSATSVYTIADAGTIVDPATALPSVTVTGSFVERWDTGTDCVRTVGYAGDAILGSWVAVTAPPSAPVRARFPDGASLRLELYGPESGRGPDGRAGLAVETAGVAWSGIEHIRRVGPDCEPDTSSRKVRGMRPMSARDDDVVEGGHTFTGSVTADHDGYSETLTWDLTRGPGDPDSDSAGDGEGDGYFDIIDNCDNIEDPSQADRDGDGIGDACEGYVALGDSFSSGYGIAPYYEGTHTEQANDCQRSPQAFGPLVAERYPDLFLTFGACQGAKTIDFDRPQQSTVDNPEPWGTRPQLDYLSRNTRLVTLNVGGNDAGFSTVVGQCIVRGSPTDPCSDDEDIADSVAQAFTRLDNRADEPAAITPLPTLVRALADRLLPSAEIVIVGYPHIFPPAPTADCERIGVQDQAWMVEKIDEMNAILERSTRGYSNVRFVNPNPRFDGHELCSGDAWFYTLNDDGMFHPTPAGHRALADAVIEALEADGFDPQS
jgi:lysophospholipase L1-like esterase